MQPAAGGRCPPLCRLAVRLGRRGRGQGEQPRGGRGFPGSRARSRWWAGARPSRLTVEAPPGARLAGSAPVEVPCVARVVEVLRIRISAFLVNFKSSYFRRLDGLRDYGRAETQDVAVEAAMLRRTLRAGCMASAQRAVVPDNAARAAFRALSTPERWRGAVARAQAGISGCGLRADAWAGIAAVPGAVGCLVAGVERGGGKLEGSRRFYGREASRVGAPRSSRVGPR